VPTEIGRDELSRLVRGGAQLVEVLPREEYEDAHLPGAVHIPLRRIDGLGPAMLDRGRPVIVYCWDSA
jgi:rhodanese-related sulfurtransferase